MKNILFVCTGNTCRSPMAMAVCKKLLNEKGITDIEVLSAGIAADGSKISDNSAKALSKIGIELNDYRSKQLTMEMLNVADIILVMTNGHKNILLDAGVESDKILVLSGGVSDPFGQSYEVYEKCLDEIINGVNKLIEKGVIG